MAGYELPQIGNGSKAAQVWVYPTLPTQDDHWTDSILVQAHKYVNCGLRIGADAQSMLAAMGFDPTAHGKWFDLMSPVTLQRKMPEEDGDYAWRDVYHWLVWSGMEFETIVDSPYESCLYRLGVIGAHWSFGQGILRIGTS